MSEVVIKRGKVTASVVEKYLPAFVADGWEKCDEKETEAFLKKRSKGESEQEAE